LKTWNITATSSPSLATAEAQAQPGDTILLSGRFANTSLVPKVSGAASAPITYKAGSSGATFDGAGPYGVAAISSRAYLVLDGITFTNSSYKTAPVANKGIILRSSNHVTFQNCTLSYMQMQLIGSSDNKIINNKWREFVAVYTNGQPQTSGDMLNLVSGSNRNLIQGNDMKYAGHSLIEVGNGFGGTNADNQISGNTLSNPWYKCLILADDGAGTVVDTNQLLDANSVPTLYSTVPGQVGTLQTSSDAVQFSGSNYILRNNRISNTVATYGVVTLGGRWYVDSNHPNGVLVESLNNQIYGNTIQNSKAAAVFSFIEFLSSADISAGRTAVPRISGNLIHHNTLAGNAGTPYSWNKSPFFSTVIYHSATQAPQWVGLNGNKMDENTGFDATNAYLVDGAFKGSGASVHSVKTLAQFEALDPNHVYGNTATP
jgi:hypothetical protein